MLLADPAQLDRGPPEVLTDADQSVNMRLPSFAVLRSLSASDRNPLFPSSESALTFRPRYLSSTIEQQYAPVLPGTQGGRDSFYFVAFTRRHIGAARTR
jgi:hypothetical protein